ncbi:MAG: hypothetical protein ABIX46_01645, partial [Burkholderiaceae bacterium]
MRRCLAHRTLGALAIAAAAAAPAVALATLRTFAAFDPLGIVGARRHRAGRPIIIGLRLGARDDGRPHRRILCGLRTRRVDDAVFGRAVVAAAHPVATLLAIAAAASAAAIPTPAGLAFALRVDTLGRLGARTAVDEGRCRRCAGLGAHAIDVNGRRTGRIAVALGASAPPRAAALAAAFRASVVARLAARGSFRCLQSLAGVAPGHVITRRTIEAL